MLAALAFVPCADLEFAFDSLCKSEFFVNNADKLDSLLDYFQRTWLGAKGIRGRRKPLFNVEMWNCFDRVVDDDLRTTNSVEGWHNSLNKEVSRARPSLGKFINCLKDEQSQIEIFLAQIGEGRDVVPNERLRYADSDARLKNIVAKYDKDHVIQYLRAVA